MAAAAVGRMAMNPGFFKQLGNFFNPGKMGTLDAVMRFGPDVFFGGMAAMQTPGDLADKAIAFGSTAAPALVGGLGASGAVRHFGKNKMKPEDLGALMNAADMGGSILGDMVGYPAGAAIQRGKDKLMGGLGETPFERLGREDQQAMAAQLEQDILARYGLIPRTREDDYLRELGLG